MVAGGATAGRGVAATSSVVRRWRRRSAAAVEATRPCGHADVGGTLRSRSRNVLHWAWASRVPPTLGCGARAAGHRPTSNSRGAVGWLAVWRCGPAANNANCCSLIAGAQYVRTTPGTRTRLRAETTSAPGQIANAATLPRPVQTPGPPHPCWQWACPAPVAARSRQPFVRPSVVTACASEQLVAAESRIAPQEGNPRSKWSTIRGQRPRRRRRCSRAAGRQTCPPRSRYVGSSLQWVVGRVDIQIGPNTSTKGIERRRGR